jgi:hypothetical protein
VTLSQLEMASPRSDDGGETTAEFGVSDCLRRFKRTPAAVADPRGGHLRLAPLLFVKKSLKLTVKF